MFERPPFRNCQACGHQHGTGILWVGADFYSRRCRFCAAKTMHPLPPVDKKVLYLDQFAVSEIYKIRKGIRKANAPHAEFWSEAAQLLNLAVLRQRIICPASDIHHDESIVYRDGNALALVHEMMGGDTSFESTTTIEHQQIFQHLTAYLKGEEPPPFKFNVDDILHGSRNDWLQDLHITVNTDWSSFVEITRNARDRAAENFAPLYERWVQTKPTFNQALNDELGALARGYIDAYSHFTTMAHKAMISGDMHQYIDGAMSPVITLIEEIKRAFVKRGASEEHAYQETAKFLSWPRNRSLPHHWIAAHLYAVIARRLSLGQKRRPSRGMMNDIKAISFYGPYVDAMFLDNECVSLLEDKLVSKGVKLKAQVFCLRTSGEFLAYLQDLIDSSPQDVIEASRELYGID